MVQQLPRSADVASTTVESILRIGRVAVPLAIVTAITAIGLVVFFGLVAALLL
ncbi:hypothetical protein ACLI4Z_02965 [Natrialbaceae archaeon A-arb3/5]